MEEHFLPGMSGLLLTNIQVEKNLLAEEKYKYLFSVEEVNKLVLSGMPFRDAYKKVGHAIDAGEFKYDPSLAHTHEGSIGNLQNDKIASKMQTLIASFPFIQVKAALAKLAG